MSGGQIKDQGLAHLLSQALGEEMEGVQLEPSQVTWVREGRIPESLSGLTVWAGLVSDEPEEGRRLLLASSDEGWPDQLEELAETAARVLGVEQATTMLSGGQALESALGADCWILVTLPAMGDEGVLHLLLDEDMGEDLAPEASEPDSAEPTEHEFEVLTPGNGGAPAGPEELDPILDVPLDITVRLGSARRRVRDILALNSGAVLELDRQAGEAVDILVNGRMLAQGEVVIIDDNFGVRITDILSHSERINRLS